MPPATSQIWRFSQGVYASGKKITFGKTIFYKWQLAHMIFQIVRSAQAWQSCVITYFRVHASVLTKSSLSLVVLGDQESRLFSLGSLQTFQSRNALSSFPSCYPWTLGIPSDPLSCVASQGCFEHVCLISALFFSTMTQGFSSTACAVDSTIWGTSAPGKWPVGDVGSFCGGCCLFVFAMVL